MTSTIDNVLGLLTLSAVETYINNLVDRLLKEGRAGGEKWIGYIVFNQFWMERENGAMKYVPMRRGYAYGMEALKRKAIELAPEFLRSYAEAEQSGTLSQRVFNSNFVQVFRVLAVPAFVALSFLAAVAEFSNLAVGSAAGVATGGVAYIVLNYVTERVDNPVSRRRKEAINTFKERARGAFKEAFYAELKKS